MTQTCVSMETGYSHDESLPLEEVLLVHWTCTANKLFKSRVSDCWNNTLNIWRHICRSYRCVLVSHLPRCPQVGSRSALKHKHRKMSDLWPLLWSGLSHIFKQLIDCLLSHVEEMINIYSFKNSLKQESSYKRLPNYLKYQSDLPQWSMSNCLSITVNLHFCTLIHSIIQL